MEKFGPYVKIQVCPSCGWFPNYPDDFPGPPSVNVCPECGNDDLSWTIGRFVHVETRGFLFGVRRTVIGFRRKSDDKELRS